MTIKDKLRLSKNISFISGIFCIAVSLLLLLNYYQYSKSEPLESKTIEALVDRLHEEPNNEELKEEIRNFDLLARKAYFNSRWQVKTGAFLLLFGAIVFAVGIRYYYSLKAKIEEPEQQTEDEIADRILSQKWIIFSGGGLLILALIASFGTKNYLQDYTFGANNTSIGAQTIDESIEIVDVGRNTGSSASITEPISEPIEQVTNDNQSEEPFSRVQEETDQAEPPASVSNTTSAGNLTEAQVNSNYNSFRGPWGNGVSKFTNVPVEWDGASGTNLLWKAEIPKPGFNSPVIWEDKIFLSGGDEEARIVYCFDKNTGNLLWSKKADNIDGSPSTMPNVSHDTGLAAPSVTTDGKRVCAIFATGDIICFDMNGNRLWARNLGVPENHYGHSSSLLTWDGKIFVQYDTNKGGKILALNAATGENVWETQRNTGISWASPVLADLNGTKQVVLTSAPIVAGYDAITGEELWSVECMMGEVGPSVTVGDSLVFAANEYARLAAINPVDGTIVWEDDYYLPEVASPVCSDGLLIIATSYGVLVCYDAKAGEMLWEEDYGSGFYASPVIADNKIYALDVDGVMHILELSREAKIIAESELGEDGFASPAFSNGKIFIRGEGTLYCFGK